MARNNVPDRGDAWLLAVGKLPMWVCGPLALASYLFFHAMALRPYLLVTDPAHLRSALPAIVLEGLFEAMQYLAPLMLLVGVPLVRWIADAGVVPQPAARALSGPEFDLLVGEGLRMRRVTLACA